MARVRMTFEGGRELEAALGGLGSLYRRRKAGRDALKEASEIVLEKAQATAPVRNSGEKTFRVGGETKRRRRGALKLHLSIGTRLTRNQRRQQQDKMPVEVYIGTRDRAGPLTEFGTRHAPAQGWLRRAWANANPQNLLTVIGHALWRQISRQAELQARAGRRAQARARRAAR